MSDIHLLFQNRDFAVIEKPAGIPSESDPSGDPDAMSLTSALLRERGENEKLWLIHRLDRTVGGVLAFARNEKSAAAASALIAGRESKKEYLAVCEGVPAEGTYRDYLYKDARQGKAFCVSSPRKGVKEAELLTENLASVQDGERMLTLVHITLLTGRFHQIRVQFSSRKTPLAGDKKYGSRTPNLSMPSLYAVRFSLPEPCRIDVFHLPDLSCYPWNLFKKENYPCALT